MSGKSSKEIYDIQQRLFYIDKHVNTFFNKQIVQIQMALTQMNARLRQIEKKLDLNNEPAKTPQNNAKLNKNNNIKRSGRPSLSSNIRTVNLG